MPEEFSQDDSHLVGESGSEKEPLSSPDSPAGESPEFDQALADLLDQEAATAGEKTHSAEEAYPASEADAASNAAVAELRSDLQRLQAEFVNYKARVERDRDVARNNAIAEAMRAFLPALDDLARAEAHGDLEGSPFAAVVSKLRNAGDKFGLKQFGAKGEKFDPELHNALVQTPNPEVSENVIADVVEPGYMLGDRLLRPAMVAVFIPAE
jgi:molecular chaperone GrpE